MNDTKTYNEFFDCVVFFSLLHPDWDLAKTIEFSKQYFVGQQNQVCAG